LSAMVLFRPLEPSRISRKSAAAVGRQACAVVADEQLQEVPQKQQQHQAFQKPRVLLGRIEGSSRGVDARAALELLPPPKLSTVVVSPSTGGTSDFSMRSPAILARSISFLSPSKVSMFETSPSMCSTSDARTPSTESKSASKASTVETSPSTGGTSDPSTPSIESKSPSKASTVEASPSTAAAPAAAEGVTVAASKIACAAVPLVERIAEILREYDQLKGLVPRIFQKASDGKATLDLASLGRFRSFMAEELQVPERTFGNLADLYARFDSNGDGALQEQACYELTKCHLREYQRRLSLRSVEVSVPFESLQIAGYTTTPGELGHGNQGVLKLAVDRDRNKRCIKLVRKSAVGEEGLRSLRAEFEIMKGLHHSCIAQTCEIFQDSLFYYMVNEPYFGGDFTKLRRNASARGVQLSEEWWRTVFQQCLEGICYLHQKAVMHCDIKEPNLMLKTEDYERPEVVIIDFGLGQSAASDRMNVCGTPGYIPPETWVTQKWFPKGDCFSFGVAMLQLLIDHVPITFEGPKGAVALQGGIFTVGTANLQEVGQVTQVRSPPFDRLPKGCSPRLAKLLARLLQKRPTYRANAVQALQDEWFSMADVGTVDLPSPSTAAELPSKGANLPPPSSAALSPSNASSVGGMFVVALAAKRFTASSPSRPCAPPSLQVPPGRPACVAGVRGIGGGTVKSAVTAWSPRITQARAAVPGAAGAAVTATLGRPLPPPLPSMLLLGGLPRARAATN